MARQNSLRVPRHLKAPPCAGLSFLVAPLTVMLALPRNQYDSPVIGSKSTARDASMHTDTSCPVTESSASG